MKIQAILDAKGSEVRTIEAGELATTAAERMRRHGVGALIVVTGGRIDGIVAERDLVRAIVDGDGSVEGKLVRDVMSTQVDTCEPDHLVKDVMAVMTRSRSRHVPVVDERGLCGLVSIGDMVKSHMDEIVLESRVLRDAYLSKH